ncbi:MAG: ABC transporter permease subunit [Proteobacteria bacterium]|nr:ABC transporter permease subunit [Pseudomonadota bacterium]
MNMKPFWATLMLIIPLWFLLSFLLTTEVLPTPWQTLGVLKEILLDGEVFIHLGATLYRVAWSFTLAMLVGVIFGVIMGLYPVFDNYFNPSLIIGLNIPAIITTVILYVVLGLNDWAAIIAVALNKIPIVVVIMRDGTRNLDNALFEMAAAYKVPKLKVIKNIVLPQLVPHLMSSARTGLSLIWKIVLVVEFLGRGNGIGFQIHLFFQDFDLARIISYTMILILVMLLIDSLILTPIERSCFAWRKPIEIGN